MLRASAAWTTTTIERVRRQPLVVGRKDCGPGILNGFGAALCDQVCADNVAHLVLRARDEVIQP
jgi:hypothetical protein